MPDSSILTELGQDAAMGGIQGLYLYTPAETIRAFSDSLFPALAHNSIADIAVGQGHRFKAGHDLLIDVIASQQSFSDKLSHAGHILLTDFPTKAGIPIPGFSQSGLGQMLVALGIPKGYLCLNICDVGMGIIAIPEGSLDLMHAITGDLPMNAWTFFDTFGEGALEIGTGLMTENPLLLIAGAENLAAGVISGMSALNQYIDQQFVSIEEFFGYGMTGFMIGCVLTTLNSRGKTKKGITKNFATMTGRSLLLGGLGSLSVAFSLGAAVGLLGFALGKYLAHRAGASYTQEQFKACLSWNQKDPLFAAIWKDMDLPPLICDRDLETFLADGHEIGTLLPDNRDLQDYL